MRRSGCGRPSAARIGRLIHGPVSTAGGQVPSFSPPSTSRSARCRRASSGPQMARRGWRPKPGRMISGSSMADSSAGHSPPAIAVLAGPGRAQAGQGVGQRFAGLAGPQRLGRGDPSAAAMLASSRACRRGAGLPSAPQVPTSRRRAGRPASRRRADPRDRRIWPSRCGRGWPACPASASARAGTCGRAVASASSNAARSPPSVHSGCFSKASRATGAKPSSTAVTSARSKAAGGVSARRLRRPNRRCRCPSA